MAIDPSIITNGAINAQLQQQNNMKALGDLGGSFGKLVLGRRINQMRQLATDEEQNAFANKSIFAPMLNETLTADRAAAIKAKNDQLKFDADLRNTIGQASEREANAGSTKQKTGASRYGLGQDVWMAVAQSGGNPDAGRLLLNRHLQSGAIDQSTFDSMTTQLDGMKGQPPSAIQSLAFNQAKAMLDPKYSFQSEDNRADNATSERNNERTTQASMYSTDVGAETDKRKLEQENRQYNTTRNDEAGKYTEYGVDVQGRKYGVLAGSGKAVYLKGPDGGYITEAQKGATNAQATSQAEESKRITRVATILDAIGGVANSEGVRDGGLLKQATNSYVGRGIDYVGRALGMATDGDVATGQLGTLSGQLVALMPKMTGPQSDKDVAMYKQMAGQLDDPTVPYRVRMAALETIDNLNKKYAEQQYQGIPYRDAGQGGGQGSSSNGAVNAASSKWGI